MRIKRTAQESLVMMKAMKMTDTKEEDRKEEYGQRGQLMRTTRDIGDCYSIWKKGEKRPRRCCRKMKR